MATVLCVLYDDPVDGYPPAYARDEIPAIARYPDGQTTPTYLVNTARGKICDRDAVVRALESGRLAAGPSSAPRRLHREPPP